MQINNNPFRNSHNPFDINNVDKNYIEHDQIFIMGTINYTARYRLFNAIADVVHEKASMAQQLFAQKFFTMPVIHFNIACADTKEYTSQTEQLFRILEYARKHMITIETNVVEPICLNSWAGRIVREFASPGFRNMYEDAHYYYYPQTYDPIKNRTVLSPTAIIISPEQLFSTGLCNTIFLNNGKIRTR